MKGASKPERERPRLGVRAREPQRQEERRQCEGEQVNELQPETHRSARRGDVRPWAKPQNIERHAADKADNERGHDPPAEPDRFRYRIGGKRGDEFGGFHSTDLRQAAPSDLSAQWSATLTAISDIDRRFTDAAIDWRGVSVSRSFLASR